MNQLIFKIVAVLVISILIVSFCLGQSAEDEVSCECGSSSVTIDHEVIKSKYSKGKVVFFPEKPILGAKVLITDSYFKKVEAKAMTDSKGRFSINTKSNLIYLVVCKDGFSRARAILKIDNDAENELVTIELGK